MLINTVILFLNDALPIVIITVLLLTIAHKLQRAYSWVFIAILLSIITTITLIYFIDNVAQIFDSTGLELLFALGYFCIYSFIIALLFLSYCSVNGRLWMICGQGILICVATLNGADFLVYITGYWSQVDVLQSLAVGIILSLGICISIGILLYFLIIYSDQRLSIHTSSVLILFYGAGQLIKASNLLLQIDVLPSSSPLWDVSFLITENSELGHFLSALFGYDASPSLYQLIIYLTALLLPCGFITLLNKVNLNKKSFFCMNNSLDKLNHSNKTSKHNEVRENYS